jgi:hypothetical protein
MKTVFTDVRQIAHLWMHQQQEEAKNPSRNFWFSRNTIYSYGYHFPIAMHVTNDNGDRAILFTTRSYSNTTSKHLSVVRSAIPSYENVIYCYTPTDTPQDNINRFIWAIEEALNGIIRARKPEKYIAEAQRICEQAKKYIAFFGVKTPEQLERLYSLANTDEYVKYMEDKREMIEREEKARLKKQLKKFKEDVKDWRDFKINRLYGRYTDRDFLRINTLKNVVETSQGIEIPVDVALRFNRSVENCLTNGLCDGMKILSYSVKDCNKQYIHIGCHKIDHKERLDIINKLNQYYYENNRD